MNFRDTEQEAAFRKEVRAFLEKEMPGGFGKASGPAAKQDDAVRRGVDRFGVSKEWTKKLAAKGWTAPAWPKEYGGAGMTVMEQFIFNEEMATARAPRTGGIGTGFAGPTVITYGTDEQKSELLPGIVSGEDIWCQGFSEPESGSDLASLKTSAVRDGDDYVINGQKIWTTGAQFAKRMILLARTDPDAPKHKGISYFLLDMKSPGVDVRPLVNMAGTQGFSEVFFEDVRVPAKDLLGEENRGWYVATTTLDFERSSIGTSIAQQNQLEDLIVYVKDRSDGSLNPTVKLELAERSIEAETARLLSYRVITLQNRGQVPNHEASAVKLYASELNQRVATTALKCVGLYGQLDRNSEEPESAAHRYAPSRGRFMRSYLNAVSSTIAGGTSEINRGVMATRGLGLPRG
ncbi:MAG: acyl-CoA dehydrogenase family protein [Chloroflexi bacterium]|nr:acyl-CoA dehydrogenase family protein [Chloroflexota bacterium]